MNTLGIALLFVAKSLWDLFRLSADASVVAVVGAACWCYENFAGILVMFAVLLPLIAYEMTPGRQDLITLSDVHEPLAGLPDDIMRWNGEHWVDGEWPRNQHRDSAK